MKVFKHKLNDAHNAAWKSKIEVIADEISIEQEHAIVPFALS